MWVKPGRNGKIRYCESYKDYLTDKTKEVSVTFDKDTARNRKEAQKILSEKIKALVVPQKSELTLSDIINEYKKDTKPTMKDSTYRRNCFALTSVSRILGADVMIDRLTARYIRQRLIATGYPATQLNGYLKRFKTLIRWAYSNDLIDSTKIIDQIECFPDVSHHDKIAEKYLETDELRLLLDSMTVEQWKLMTEFLALSGLRCGELIALEKADIDLENKKISVRHTLDPVTKVVTSAKTESSCDDVVIQPQLESCIHRMNSLMLKQALVNGYKTTLFVSNDKGDYVNYYSFNKYFKENTLAVIGRQLTTHSLRHTHASLLFEQGFTLDEVARRLRHANSKVTREVYIHVTQKLREKDAEKLLKTNLI